MNDDNWNGVPLAAIGSGAYRVPDELPALTTGLDDYEQRDPNELAMMRMRNSVRPIAGRADISPEHLAHMLVTGGTALAAPEALAARAVMSGVAQAPRAATALGALGTYLFGTGEAGSEEKPKTPKEIIAEQKMLAARGIYKGAVDGKEGPDTLAARAEAQRQDQAAVDERANRELRLKELNATSAGNETENARIGLENRQIDERATANARMKAIDDAVSPFRKAYRDYAAPAGYVVGGVAGAKLRSSLVKGADALAARKASNAEAAFDVAFEGGKKGLPDRVARINQFYRGGGRGDAEPFLHTPTATPGVAPNPNAAPLSSLYQAPTKWNGITDVGALGLFGAESAYGQFVMGADAKKELEDARGAVKQDASDANIRRLQAAIDKDAWAQFMTNFGRGGGIGYGGKMALKFRDQSPPNMARAESEKLGIEELLRQPPRKPRAPKIESQAEDTPRPRSRSRSRASDEGETLGDILGDPLGR